MDRKMMNAWLAEQAKKAPVTEAQMQRKRLGIKEGVNYGDINFRVPVDLDTGLPIYSLTKPRSPESAANLTRRLENLYTALADPKTPIDTRERIANMLMAKGVAPEGTNKAYNHTDVVGDLIKAAGEGKSVSADVLSGQGREMADRRQVQLSKNTRTEALRAKQAAANRIGGSKLPKALGVAGPVLGIATGASADDLVYGLNPLSIFGDSPAGLGSELVYEPEPDKKVVDWNNPEEWNEKELPSSWAPMLRNFEPLATKLSPMLTDFEALGPKLGKPSAKKINENNMMNAWLAGQAQKAQITSADIQRKRLGISESHIRTQPGSGSGLLSNIARASNAAFGVGPRAGSRAALDTKHTIIDPGPKPPSLLQRPLPQYDPDFSEDGVPRMLDSDRIPMYNLKPNPGAYQEGNGPLSPEQLDYNSDDDPPSLVKKQPNPRTRRG